MATRKHRREVRSEILSALAIVLMSALWIVFVGGVQRDEMVVGAGVLLLSAVFLYLIWRVETLKLDLHTKDVAQGCRIPWNVAGDVWRLIIILARDLFGSRRAGSFYRVCTFRKSGPEPQFAARDVLATAFTTMAPNSIVIGIDREQGRMLFHQLQRTSIPKMTQALGAQPEVPKR